MAGDVCVQMLLSWTRYTCIPIRVNSSGLAEVESVVL